MVSGFTNPQRFSLSSLLHTRWSLQVVHRFRKTGDIKSTVISSNTSPRILSYKFPSTKGIPQKTANILWCNDIDDRDSFNNIIPT